MSKVPIVFPDDDDADTNISVDERFMDGGSQGLGFDQLGGFEFETDSLLFPSFQADTVIDPEDWNILLADGNNLLLSSGFNLIRGRQA
jgi:hypothetical protein